MADHDDVDVEFLLSHGDWSWLKSRGSLSAKTSVKLQLAWCTQYRWLAAGQETETFHAPVVVMDGYLKGFVRVR